ncbi:MAG: DUF433 domain-containing protein [Candidatus Nanohalobium sp.]
MAEIVSTSDTLGGKPRIEGTRVSAEQVYEMYTVRDMSAEEIAEELPTVDVEDVAAAVEFMEKYRENSEEAATA